MVQQLFSDIEFIKKEILRLKGELHRIALGGVILPGAAPSSSIPSPLEGAIIYGTDEPAWARLAPDDDDKVLTLVGGLPSWEDSQAGGRWYIPFGSEASEGEVFSP